MSQDSHDGHDGHGHDDHGHGHGHDDHGHGHGHGHDDHGHGHGPNIKGAVTWAMVIILGFVIGAVYLTKTGLAENPPTQVADKPAHSAPAH